MVEITIKKIHNGDYAVLLDGKVHSEHSTLDGARRMASSLKERETVIDRNQLLRSLLVRVNSIFSPDVNYIGIPTSQIRQETAFMQSLANNLGLYTGQEAEESEV